MKASALSEDEVTLLRGVSGLRSDRVSRDLDLSVNELREVERAIAQRLTEAGFEQSGEPNALGLRLEALLDKVLRRIWAAEEPEK